MLENAGFDASQAQVRDVGIVDDLFILEDRLENRNNWFNLNEIEVFNSAYKNNSCHTQGFMSFSVHQKEKWWEQRPAFRRKGMEKLLPLSCSGLEPASVTEEVFVVLPCLRGLGKLSQVIRRTLYSPYYTLFNLISISSFDIKSLLVNIHCVWDCRDLIRRIPLPRSLSELQNSEFLLLLCQSLSPPVNVFPVFLIGYSVTSAFSQG